MCVPLAAAAAIASTAASIGSQVVGFVGQQQAAGANRVAANENFAMKDQQLQAENARLSEQQTEENLTNAVRFAQSEGRIAASATGYGAYTTHGALTDAAEAYNRTLGINDTNYANKRADLQTERIGANIQRTQQIASMPSPSLGQLALGILGSAAQGATTYAALGGRFGVQPASGAPQTSTPLWQGPM